MKYAVFSLILPEFQPAEAARRIKEAGYQGVEWRCAEQPDPLPSHPNFWNSNQATLDLKKWRNQVSDFRQITWDQGLECPNLATYCRVDRLDEVKVAIEIAKELGSPRFRVCAPPYDGKTHYSEVFKRTRQGCEEVADLCDGAGVQALLELHMGNIAPSASLGFRLVEGLDPRALGVMHDAGNMVVEGFESWKIGCELLGPYLAYCHAKNMRYRPTGVTSAGGIAWEMETCEMNAGLVDWTAVFKALKSISYDGWISSEDLHTGGKPGERLKSGLQHLKLAESLAV